MSNGNQKEASDDRLGIFAVNVLFFVYFVVLAINAIQACLGRAELARHHFIPFALVAYAWWEATPSRVFRCMLDAICVIVIAVAKGMLSLFRTIKALPGMFVRALISNYQQA